MTAVKEQFMQMLPQMQRDVPSMPDSDVQLLMNYYFQLKLKNEPKEEPVDTSIRIGAAKGEFKAPDDFDATNDEVYAMMERYALS